MSNRVTVWAKIRNKCYLFDLGKMHTLPQRFLNFFRTERGLWSDEKISQDIDFSLLGNHATTRTIYDFHNSTDTLKF